MWLLTPVAYGAEAVGKCFGTTFKLNRFNVRVLTMHRWFNISAAERDLHYKVSAACVMCWRELCSCVVLMCDVFTRVATLALAFNYTSAAHALCSLLSHFARVGTTRYRGSRCQTITRTHARTKLTSFIILLASNTPPRPPSSSQANWLPNFLKTQGESNASVVG